MIKILSQKRFLKAIAVFLAINLLVDIMVPTIAYGLTTGPSQPEIQSFEPIGTSEMVNLFSGDFTYNIPLFELPGPNGGYPFNLAYNSGIGMDQEASWVGLGWNLQPGSMTRSMSGMPDEFSGDQILKKMDMKEDVTLGVTAGATFELFGIENKAKTGKLSGSLNVGLGIYNNSYRGMSTEISVGSSLSGSLMKPMKDKLTAGISLGLQTQITLNSQDGVDIGTGGSVGLAYQNDKNENRQLGLSLTTDIGFNYNHMKGLEGMTIGVNADATIEQKIGKKSDSKEKSKDNLYVGTSLSAGKTYTLATANSGYTPQVAMPFIAKSFAADVKIGPGVSGAYPSGTVGVTYSSQRLKNANKWTAAPAYGYQNLQDANENPNSILDFNREKDGIIRDESPNLWMPRLTYDSYSVTGHGIFGSFRPYRRDIGAVWDQTIRSESSGHTAGAEVGLGPSLRIGANYGYNSAYSQSNRWSFIDNYKFQSNKGNKPITYFKAHGEPSSKKINTWDKVGTYSPVRFKKNVTDKHDYQVDNILVKEKTEAAEANTFTGTNLLIDNEKERRNSIVLPITNKDLLDDSKLAVLREFNLQYFDQTNTSDVNALGEEKLTNYHREVSSVAPYISEQGTINEDLAEVDWVAKNHQINKVHHVAGFLNVDPNGLRYVYGLPVYNIEQVDAQFSFIPSDETQRNADVVPIKKTNTGTIDYKISGTDEYLSKTKLPPYAYSYMLTSILGVDYVDADDIPGPSDGDLGYWVKFNYRKVSDNYQWRIPFAGAKFNPGIKNTAQDNRASYTYGKKEVWYLATAETASHKAYFNISPRKDGRGAASELQNPDGSSTMSGYSYQLDEINLFSKLDPTIPIKTIKMAYNTQGTLCEGVLNNFQSDDKSGKLTLNKLWFEYRGNSIGKHTPYIFNYGYLENGQQVNPSYAPYNVDRWGNYRNLEDIDEVARQIAKLPPTLTGATREKAIEQIKWQFQLDFPYVCQNVVREKLDRYASAWQLTNITVPSGGKINIEYESDDYAYVQNKTAMYMTDIVAVSSDDKKYGDLEPFPSTITDDMMRLYIKDDKKERKRIYFKLKEPISKSISSSEQHLEIMKYIDHTWQLYFKVMMHLHKEDNDRNVEFVAGYADIEKFNTSQLGNLAGLVGDKNGNYTHAFITVKGTAKKKKWHPFSVAAWQHIQVNQPDLYTNKPNLPDPNSGDKATIRGALGLSNMGEFLSQMFNGFFRWAGKKQLWGRKMVEGKSWIRLNVPNKIKVGGGTRVKKLTLSDEWELKDDEGNNLLPVKAAQYGQVYDYTTTDENGQTISSGVAAYEPLMGGDEIAIRTANPYTESVKMRNDNDFFFEYPINESFYPAPSVGYSKVTVKSLASADAKNYNKDGVPSGFHSTSGVTVHEFYTAKDFPILTGQTVKDDKMGKPKTKFKVVLKESIQQSIATQGYSVILNNMHGQQKRISNYAMDDEGNVKTDPLSWVQYDFKKKEAEAHGLPAYELVNQVSTLVEDKDGKSEATLETRIIGEEMDFFVDARESINYSESDGGSFNLDMAGLPALFNFPIIMVLPNLQRSKITSRAISTNKVISRIGIMEKVTAWDQGAKVATTNEVWDAQTGEVVLTSVDNNFNDKIYNYSIPAHLKYEGLGGAYQNIGMRIDKAAFSRLIAKADAFPEDGNTPEYKENYYVLSSDLTEVSAKDFYPGDEFIVSKAGTPITKMIYVGKEKEALAFYSTGEVDVFIGQSEESEEVSLFLYRSGRRNLLTAKVGSITAKKNPLLAEENGGARKTAVSPHELPELTVPICPTGDCQSTTGKEDNE